MKTLKPLSLIALLAVFGASALADDHPRDPNPGTTHHDSWFDGGAELNFSHTTGNTKIQQIGASGAVDVRGGAFTTRLKSSYLRNSVDDIARAETFTNKLRTGANVANNLDFFAEGNFLRNTFSGINQEWLVDAGLGLYAINSEPFSLNVEGGPGYLKENLVPGDTASFLAGVVGAYLRLKLSETADILGDGTFIHNFRESSDWRLKSNVALATKITQMVSFKVGFDFNKRHIPVPGFKSEDTATTLGLVFKF
jgi:putative salt-induced outer membrane protein YdiY